jgi:gamma-glutamyltranspeptidase
VLVRSTECDYEFIDFREMAPAAAGERMFTEETIKQSLRGGLGKTSPHLETIFSVVVPRFKEFC